MKAVIQRVTESSLDANGARVSEIGPGLVVLLAVEGGDGDAQRQWMASKLANLRVFPDEDGRMNRSLIDTGGEMLLVSNFTVAGDCRKGRRPSWDGAMAPDLARAEFDRVLEACRDAGISRVCTGVFGADMHVRLTNDGPVTLVIEAPR